MGYKFDYDKKFMNTPRLNLDLLRTNHNDTLFVDNDFVTKLYKLNNWWEDLKERYQLGFFNGNDVHITSGYRSHKVNKEVGGSKYSQHTYFEAIDFTCEHCEAVFHKMYNDDDILQLIYYKDKNFIHISMNNDRGTKIYRGKK